MGRLTITLLAAFLLIGNPNAAVAEDHSESPWFGGFVETPEFRLTIPDDWIAVELDGDLRGAARSVAEWIDRISGACGTPRCEEDLYRFLEDERATARLLAISPPDPSAPGLDGTTQCQIAGPAWVGRALSEVAGIAFEAYEQSEVVELSDPPRAWQSGGEPAYAFDFAMPAIGLEGVLYFLGGADRFVRLGCLGPSMPEDRWLSIAETFEFLPMDGGPEPSVPPGSAGGQQASNVPDLEAMLPVWVAGRPMARYSRRGLDYLSQWSRMPAERLRALEEDPTVLGPFSALGIELEDIQFANAGRSDTGDPPYFVTALRLNGIPAHRLPLGMVVDHPDAGTWSEATFGNRVVQVGTEAMLKQYEQRRGRPYVYDVGDVRFLVTTDDESWAAEAIARLRPDPVVENAALFVSLPGGWRPGFTPTLDEATKASLYDSGIVAAAHDGSKLDEPYVPTLTIAYTDTRLDTDVVPTLDSWAREYPDEDRYGSRVQAIEQVSLPSGEATRLELINHGGEPPFAIAEIRYLIASPAGVFDLLFSVAEVDLAEYEATFDAIARSFMRSVDDRDGAVARVARGEMTRTEYEMLEAEVWAPPEPVLTGAVTSPGPVVLGGRIEVPSEGFAVDVPSGWHAVDVTHPGVIAAMEAFDETTRNLVLGRLTPENPLRPGMPAVLGEDLFSFTTDAIEMLAATHQSDRYVLVAIAPWNGIDGPHECALYAWDSPWQSLEDLAEATAQMVRDSDYETNLDYIRLPAGEAFHVTGAADWNMSSIYSLKQDDRFYYLECGDVTGHDELWLEVAESFEFLPDTD